MRDGDSSRLSFNARSGEAHLGRAVIGDAAALDHNDGWPEDHETNFGKNRMYRNNHDGTFTDVAEKAGLTIGTWSTGATFGDYDGDGRLIFLWTATPISIWVILRTPDRRPWVTGSASFVESR